MTVTLFPDARFSMRSRTVIFSGTASAGSPSEEAQWQSSAGQPHPGQRTPFLGRVDGPPVHFFSFRSRNSAVRRYTSSQ
jgi:hypothetical protein